VNIIWDESAAIARAAARAATTAGETHLITAEQAGGDTEGLCGAHSARLPAGGQWFTTEPGDVTCGYCRAWMAGECLAWIGAVTRKRHRTHNSGKAT
jgi:hypothetical protein